VLDDPKRAITRNKQPARCCDTGCAPERAPVLAESKQRVA